MSYKQLRKFLHRKEIINVQTAKPKRLGMFQRSSVMFWFRGYLKSNVYTNRPQNIEELKGGYTKNNVEHLETIYQNFWTVWGIVKPLGVDSSNI